MCNRESFILLPQETGIPVAWSTSYHHEEISAHIRMTTGYHDAIVRNSVQIECIGGDVRGWDWDNTPTRTVRVLKDIPHPMWYQEDHEADLEMPVFELRQEPDIPHWLEDNLHTYENKVEFILEKLNPLRDRQQRLLSCTTHQTWTPASAMRFPSIEEVLKYSHKDSPEVREFEDIVAGYLEVPGFVHSEYSRPKIEYAYVGRVGRVGRGALTLP
jgi:hypothetical protein